MSNTIIHQNDHLVLSHRGDLDVPGYMILAPKRTVKSIAELNHDELSAWVSVQQQATQALNEILEPDRVYHCIFCELMPELHMHILPRTLQLKQEYWLDNPEFDEQSLSGPLLFEWCQSAKKVSHLSDECQTLIHQLQCYFEERHVN